MQRESVSSALSERKILPRWRAPAESTDELAAVRTPEPIRPRDGWLEKLRREFRASPSTASGRDLVESAFVLGVEVPSELYQDVLREGYTVPKIIEGPKANQDPSADISTTHRTIRKLRSSLRGEPGQPLAWTELARHYLSSGLAEKAERAMQCALALAPTSRYVLRSATRFFDHIEDPDQALYALKRSGRLTADPWLLSADIALKGDRHSNSIKVGMRMLDEAVIAPRSLTELAAAIGTVEHENGRHKSVKKRIAQSLVDPNENSIAQAIYISQSDDKIKLPDAILDRPMTYEARARRSFASAGWEDSMLQSWKWLGDEPFDTRPAILGSCLGFDRSLVSQAFDIATHGLFSQPNDVLLLNNRAVAGAYLGKLDDAFSDIKHALRFDADRAYLLATIGLLAYRVGDLKFGMRAYGLSMAWLAKQKNRGAVIRAYLYWLREAVRSGQVDGQEEVEAAKKVLERIPPREVENEVPGLIEAIEIEMSLRMKGAAATTVNRKFEDYALLNLEGTICVPQEAKDLFPLIATDTVPRIDQAERLSQ